MLQLQPEFANRCGERVRAVRGRCCSADSSLKMLGQGFELDGETRDARLA
jgi:hypothetical protein